MTAYWKIIRPLNLFIIVLVFLFVRLFLWIPAAEKFGLVTTLSWGWYVLLLLSCLLIAAGGYILNDMQDTKADQINKPDRVYVGTSIKKEVAHRMYLGVTIGGLLLGVLVSFQIGHLSMLGVHIVSVVLLYMYATRWKRILLLGNVTVALLIALSVLTPVFFEPSVYDFRRPADWFAAGVIWRWILGLAIFSFLLTMAREIMKDLEDMDGDREAGDRSVPLVWGEEIARGIVSGFLFAAVFLCIKAGIYLEQAYDNTYYMIFSGVLSVVMMLTMWFVLNAKTRRNYTLISTLLKGLMLAGILILPLHYLVGRI